MDPSVLVESFNRTRWLDKLRPPGASQKADGPEGPMAKTFSHVILVLGAMLIFQYRSTGDQQFVRVILAPEPCNFPPYRGQETSGTRSALRPALPY